MVDEAKSADQHSRTRLIQALVAVGVLSVLYAMAAQTRYAGGGDAPYHILSAKAWAAGEGFRATDPAQRKYPPGWSAALVLCQWVFGGGYAIFARFTAALFPLSLAASYLFVRRRTDVATAVCSTAAIIVSAAWFDVATRSVRSEVLYTAVSIGFLAWCERAMRPVPPRLRSIAWGTLLLVATVLVRSIGVAMLLALVATCVHLAVRSRPNGALVARRIAAPLLASGGALLVWRKLSSAPVVESYPGELMNLYDRQFWMIDPHRPGLGAASLMDVLLRIPQNLRQLAAHAAELLTNIPWIAASWTSPLVVAAIVILVAGVIRELQRELPLPAYYALAYVATLSVWPFDEGTRFLAPLFPVLLIFVVSGWELLRLGWRRSPRALAHAVAALSLIEATALTLQATLRPTDFGRQQVVAAVCWFIALAVYFARGVRARRPSPGEPWPALRWAVVAYVAAFVVLGLRGIGNLALANWRAANGAGNGFQQASAWIIRNTNRSDVVMAQRPLDFQLTTGRSAALFPVTANRTVLRAALDGARARYLVVYYTAPEDAYYFPLETDRLVLLEDATSRRLVLRARLGDVSVFEARE